MISLRGWISRPGTDVGGLVAAGAGLPGAGGARCKLAPGRVSEREAVLDAGPSPPPSP
jgi:hypothetical protein